MQRAPTVASRTQLALAILLSTLSLSVGFMSTMPRTPATEQSDANAVGADDSTSKAAAAVPPQEAKRDGASRVESPAGRQAVFRCVVATVQSLRAPQFAKKLGFRQGIFNAHVLTFTSVSVQEGASISV